MEEIGPQVATIHRVDTSGVSWPSKMELDRETRMLEKGPAWGTQLAMRMMLTERTPPRQQEAPNVR